MPAMILAPGGFAESRRNRPALLAVLVLHGLLLWWMAHSRLRHHEPTRPSRSAWAWLLETPRPPPKAPPLTEPRQPLLPSIPTLRLPVPEVPNTMAPANPSPPVSEAITMPPVGAPTPQPPRPLDLSLPRAASQPFYGQRNPALDDPRSNTPRATLDERMADALGTDLSLREERMGNGARFRRGSDCYEVRTTRSAQLDPYNESLNQTPKLVEKCRK